MLGWGGEEPRGGATNWSGGWLTASRVEASGSLVQLLVGCVSDTCSAGAAPPHYPQHESKQR